MHSFTVTGSQRAAGDTCPYVVITPERAPLSLDLKNVWRYRDLIFLMTRRNFLLSYKQTVLGPFWAFIHPLFTALVYTLVFGYVAGIRTGGVPHILFYLVSNALWGYFARCVTSNAATFTANAYLFGKVWFPRLTVPVSNMLLSLVFLGIQFVIAGACLVFYAVRGIVHPNWQLVWTIPAVLLHLGVLGMAVGIVVSSLTTRYRDLSMMVGPGVHLWMYVSPVLYPYAQLESGRLGVFVAANPVTAPMELLRYVLLGEGRVMMWSIILSVAFTLALAAAGIMVFNRVDRNFMDTV